MALENAERIADDLAGEPANIDRDLNLVPVNRPPITTRKAIPPERREKSGRQGERYAVTYYLPALRRQIAEIYAQEGGQDPSKLRGHDRHLLVRDVHNGNIDPTSPLWDFLGMMDEAENRRPRTREGCKEIARPCTCVSCKFNTFLEVKDTGSLSLTFGAIEPDQMDPTTSCVLDIIDQNPEGMTLEEIGDVLHITREGIRQIEERTLTRLRDELEKEGIEFADFLNVLKTMNL